VVLLSGVTVIVKVAHVWRAYPREIQEMVFDNSPGGVGCSQTWSPSIHIRSPPPAEFVAPICGRAVTGRIWRCPTPPPGFAPSPPRLALVALRDSRLRPVLAAIKVQPAVEGACGIAVTPVAFRRWRVIVRRVMSPRTAPSRRAVLRGLTSAASALMLGGCAGSASTGARFDASALSVNPTLLVATTRKPVNGARTKPWFGPQRASAMSVARARLTPPGEGRLSLASVGLDDWRIEAIEPVSRADELLGEATSGRDVLIYVHGFNQTFEAAALDAARLSDGIRFRGETMVFSWPSKAKLFDYAYDRESAMWSRDALEQVLTGLMASPISGRIHIVAHSIGTMLTMEALRQLYARDGDAAADRIGAVVFASPDIDMDGFSSSVQRIGPLASKITVIAATNDRALAVSGWIAGGTTRVGAAEKAQLERLGLRVIDASQQSWGIINHDLFLSNAQIRQVIRRAVEARPGMGA
jgi:esterase/lipase superfamily enzyme